MFREHQVQSELVARFRLAYPGLRRVLFAIPNGGRRDRRAAGLLKAEGVLAGVPDLMLAVPSGDFSGLFIEVKRPDGRGRVSKEQREVAALLRRQGYRVEVVDSADVGMRVIEEYLTS